METVIEKTDILEGIERLRQVVRGIMEAAKTEHENLGAYNIGFSETLDLYVTLFIKGDRRPAINIVITKDTEPAEVYRLIKATVKRICELDLENPCKI